MGHPRPEGPVSLRHALPPGERRLQAQTNLPSISCSRMDCPPVPHPPRCYSRMSHPQKRVVDPLLILLPFHPPFVSLALERKAILRIYKLKNKKEAFSVPNDRSRYFFFSLSSHFRSLIPRQEFSQRAILSEASLPHFCRHLERRYQVVSIGALSVNFQSHADCLRIRKGVLITRQLISRGW